MIEVLTVAVGGAIGTLARRHAGAYVHVRANRRLGLVDEFPFGTLAVNVVGSFVLGVSAELALAGTIPGWAAVGVGTGLCGGLTTFSTVAVDLARLARDRKFLRLLLELVAGALLPIAAAWAGTLLAT